MAKNSSSKKTGGGFGFVGGLTLLFIGLKLCKVINWSWIWVISPIWITVALVIGLFILGMIIGYFSK